MVLLKEAEADDYRLVDLEREEVEAGERSGLAGAAPNRYTQTAAGSTGASRVDRMAELRARASARAGVAS